MQDERLQSLEKEFNDDIRALEAEFFAERSEVLLRFDSDKAELQAVMDTIGSDVKERTADAKSVRRQSHPSRVLVVMCATVVILRVHVQDYEQAREIIRTRSLDAIHVLQSTLDNQIEEMERAFESAHLAYLANTDQRTQEFKDLTQADQVLKCLMSSFCCPDLCVLNFRRYQLILTSKCERLTSCRQVCNIGGPSSLRTRKNLKSGEFAPIVLLTARSTSLVSPVAVTPPCVRKRKL